MAKKAPKVNKKDNTAVYNKYADPNMMPIVKGIPSKEEILEEQTKEKFGDVNNTSEVYQYGPKKGQATGKGGLEDSVAPWELMFPATDIAGAVVEGAIPLIKAGTNLGIKGIGKYLTEETILQNAYKLNPKAFKTDPAKYYRQFGKDAYENAVKENKIYAKGQKEFIQNNPEYNYLNNYNTSLSNKLSLVKPAPAPFVKKGELFFPVNRKATGKGYKGTKFSDAEYLAEGNLPNEAILPKYQQKYFSSMDKTDNVGVIRPEYNDLQNFKLYKRDWWKGYKEIAEKDMGKKNGGIINMYNFTDMKKAPKKVQAKAVGGEVKYLTPQSEDPNKIYHSKKKTSDATFGDYVSDIGRFALRQGLEGMGMQGLVKDTYKTDAIAKADNAMDEYVHPIGNLIGGAVLDKFIPGAGTAVNTVKSTLTSATADKNTQRKEGETDAEYSRRLANAGYEIDDLNAVGLKPLSSVPTTGLTGLVNTGVDAYNTYQNKQDAKAKAEAAVAAEKKKQQDEANKKAALGQSINAMNSAEVDATNYGYANGGEIKGAGTGTSDSIKAKVKPGSFVVPAENSGIAKALRKKYLAQGGEVANLKQDGGVDVKLSNGEHLFTPKEKQKLESKGIALSKLAPNAEENSSSFQEGGTVGLQYNDLVRQLRTAQAEREAKERIRYLETRLDIVKRYMDKYGPSEKTEGNVRYNTFYRNMSEYYDKERDKGEERAEARKDKAKSSQQSTSTAETTTPKKTNTQGAAVTKTANPKTTTTAKAPSANNAKAKTQSDPKVKALQEKLIAAGAKNIDGTPMKPDGVMGKNTEAAMKKFPDIKIEDAASATEPMLLDEKGYKAIDAFENSKGSPQGTSMNKGDGYSKTKEKEISDYVKNNIGMDVWNKMSPKLKMQTYSWMFNHGADDSVLKGLAHAADYDAMQKLHPGDTDESRRALTKQEALDIIKKADLSSDKVYNNYKDQALKQQYQSLADNYDPAKGGFDEGQSIYKKSWENRSTDLDYLYDGKTPPTTTANPNDSKEAPAAAAATTPPLVTKEDAKDRIGENILAAGQMGYGLYSLIKDGKMPVDKIDPEVNKAIARAEQDAMYGYDPTTKSQLKSDLESSRIGLVNLATQSAGGDAMQANALARAATNQYSKGLAELAIGDASLQAQKKGYRDNLVMNRAAMNRQLYQDKLNAFNMNQEAGAQLLGAGITNFYTNRRMDRQMKMMADAEAAGKLNYDWKALAETYAAGTKQGTLTGTSTTTTTGK